MPRTKVIFDNQTGEPLAALLETPEGTPKAYALFAHCFTCSKDIAAASRISRALADEGIATLRFDFTGLGNSDGDFSNTNFSSNLQDLQSAAKFMASEYQAPDILIGHSLGGAAVLAVSQHLPSVKAIVTIAAPATGKHIEHLFVAHKEKIAQDSAMVDLAGRQFTIKKQFLEDIARYNDTQHIERLKKALLIFHSPVDDMVSIDEAAKIYRAAKHPKSFISLANADHLLSRAKDADYVATMISTWVSRYLNLNTETPLKKAAVAHGEVMVREIDHDFTCQIDTEDHRLTGDEPLSFGGQNKGPSPYEFLLSSLGLCTAMTIRMVAKREQLPLKDVKVHLEKSLSEKDANGKRSLILSRKITLLGELDDKQYERLMLVADRCPVHKSLSGDIQINTTDTLSKA
ncbi:MAG: bifunctional alpha/beta hydrolase/OsmC family protein [Arenicellales bacterium]